MTAQKKKSAVSAEAASKNAKKDASLAEKFQELETITAWFEQEDIDLEQALPKFEQGLKLAQECKAQLDDVGNKIQKIKVEFKDLIEE